MGLSYPRIDFGQDSSKKSTQQPKRSPLYILPPELRQQILQYIIGENNIAYAVFSTTCRARVPMLWPMYDQNLDGLAQRRQTILRRKLQETAFIKATVSDWTVIEDLFGEDLDELLKTCWRRMVKTAITRGMLEILDDNVHVIGCNKDCLRAERSTSFIEYKRWYIWRRKSVSTVLCLWSQLKWPWCSLEQWRSDHQSKSQQPDQRFTQPRPKTTATACDNCHALIVVVHILDIKRCVFATVLRKPDIDSLLVLESFPQLPLSILWSLFDASARLWCLKVASPSITSHHSERRTVKWNCARKNWKDSILSTEFPAIRARCHELGEPATNVVLVVA